MSKHKRYGCARRFIDALITRSGPHCHWCKALTARVSRGHHGRLRDNHATVDHITPRCAGGTEELSNLVIACNRCNNERGNRESPPRLQPERMLITEDRLAELMA
jgi:5-methylcytosine-specific restriction endonuclease McrA